MPLRRLKNGFILLSFLVVTLVFLALAISFNQLTLWLIAYFSLGCLLADLLLWLTPLRRIRFTPVKETLRAEESSNVPISFQPRGWFWHLQMGQKSLFLPQAGTLKLKLPPQKRGLQKQIRLPLIATDLSGLLVRRSIRQIESELVILPKVARSEARELARLIQKQQVALNTGLPIETGDHRPYQMGDPMKRINWKLSAKSDELLLREQIAEPEFPILLILWTDSEELISYCYSLLPFLQHIPVELWSTHGIMKPPFAPKQWALYQKSARALSRPQQKLVICFHEDPTDPALAALRRSNQLLVISTGPTLTKLVKGGR